MTSTEYEGGRPGLLTLRELGGVSGFVVYQAISPFQLSIALL